VAGTRQVEKADHFAGKIGNRRNWEEKGDRDRLFLKYLPTWS